MLLGNCLHRLPFVHIPQAAQPQACLASVPTWISCVFHAVLELCFWFQKFLQVGLIRVFLPRCRRKTQFRLHKLFDRLCKQALGIFFKLHTPHRCPRLFEEYQGSLKAPHESCASWLCRLSRNGPSWWPWVGSLNLAQKATPTYTNYQDPQGRMFFGSGFKKQNMKKPPKRIPLFGGFWYIFLSSQSTASKNPTETAMLSSGKISLGGKIGSTFAAAQVKKETPNGDHGFFVVFKPCSLLPIVTTGFWVHLFDQMDPNGGSGSPSSGTFWGMRRGPYCSLLKRPHWASKPPYKKYVTICNYIECSHLLHALHHIYVALLGIHNGRSAFALLVCFHGFGFLFKRRTSTLGHINIWSIWWFWLQLQVSCRFETQQEFGSELLIYRDQSISLLSSHTLPRLLWILRPWGSWVKDSEEWNKPTWFRNKHFWPFLTNSAQ